MSVIQKPLFIYELANNHQGDLQHGFEIIKALKKASEPYVEKFDFAVKFQYRDIDTFIHKDFFNRDDVKNVKRFKDTRLSEVEFIALKKAVEEAGFMTMCTPFDEISVKRIIEHDFDIMKIASCSVNDWPLLEEISKTDLPVVASTAAASISQINNMVHFFLNRKIDLTVMHCVGEYPTPNDHLQLNQITYLINSFPDVRVGYSTHENPNENIGVSIAVAKGARVFEKHVGMATSEYALNGYSATPEQVANWLETASRAYDACGTPDIRYQPLKAEMEALQSLKRGAFLKKEVKSGATVSSKDVYFAFPASNGQLLAEDFSKYSRYTFRLEHLSEGAPLMKADFSHKNNRQDIEGVLFDVIDLLKESSVALPRISKCVLSHHYGIEDYEKTGVAMIEVINREYCKKLLVVLPGQSHPNHLHKMKEESFCILYGDLNCTINGVRHELVAGDTVTVERNMSHDFSSIHGCVFEEISTTHYVDDSYYTDSKIGQNRKTTVYITKELMEKHK